MTCSTTLTLVIGCNDYLSVFDCNDYQSVIGFDDEVGEGIMTRVVLIMMRVEQYYIKLG